MQTKFGHKINQRAIDEINKQTWNFLGPKCRRKERYSLSKLDVTQKEKKCHMV